MMKTVFWTAHSLHAIAQCLQVLKGICHTALAMYVTIRSPRVVAIGDNCSFEHFNLTVFLHVFRILQEQFCKNNLAVDVLTRILTEEFFKFFIM